jgi:phage terminase large subunit-like protein
MTTHGYQGDGSPNRADAFVWAMSELFPGLVQEKVERKELEVHVPQGAGSWMV